MKTKPYTKNKKTIKKPDLAEGQWTPGEYKDEMQLDRIERKLDELLSRPVYAPPSQWNVPAFWPNPPRRDEEPRYPRDWFGSPVPYANGGAR